MAVTRPTITLGIKSLSVGDPLIEVSSDTVASPVHDSGLIIERGTEDNAAMVWDESRNEFVVGTTTATGASTGDLTVTRGNLSVARVGCGTEQAEAEVHAKRDTASSPTYSTTASMIIEDNNRPSVQLVGSANNIGLIQFGDNAAAAAGMIYYDHSTDNLRVDVGSNSDRVTLDASGNLVVEGDLTVTGSDIYLGSGNNANIKSSNTAHNVAGKTLTVSAGSCDTGTTSNIAGGDLVLEGGIGKGSASGGGITFKTAKAGGSGSSANSLHQRLKLRQDGELYCGDGREEDLVFVFDGAERDYRIGVRDSTNRMEIGLGASHGTTAAIEIDDTGKVNKMAFDTSAGVVVANDYFMYLDGGAGETCRVESFVDLATAMVGTAMAASSGKIALDIAGVFPASGSAGTPSDVAMGAKFTAGATWAIGNPLYMTGSNRRLLPTDADAASTSVLIGIAMESASDGDADKKVCTVSGSIVDMEFDSAPSAGDAGNKIYLSTTAGKVTQTAPSGSGDVVQVVGVLIEAQGASDTLLKCLYQPQYIGVIA